MPMTAAQRQKKYLEKLKRDHPEKYEEKRKVHLQRVKERHTQIVKTRMVSSEQLDSLLDFMKHHPDLAKGLNRGRRGKLVTLKVWNSCAQRLNAVKLGAVKDGRGWSKYWCDWKYRVRRHALELKAAEDGDKPPPDGLTPLSYIEETIMSIIGKNTLDDLVIKRDPLADEESNDDVPESIEVNDEIATCENGTKPMRRDSCRSSEEVIHTSFDHGVAYSPLDIKSRHSDSDAEMINDAEDEATKFLKLEREKLEQSRKLTESVQSMGTKLDRLTEIMSQIKDVLVNKLNS